jgi:hypothetical protein
MMITVTLWALKSIRPASSFKSYFTLLLLAIHGEKLRNTQARLKLNPVLFHGIPPKVEYRDDTTAV